MEMSREDLYEDDLWDDDEDACEECGGSLTGGGLLCAECQREREAEELLEDMERAAIVSIFFDAFG